MNSREETSRAICAFEGFPPSYGKLRWQQWPVYQALGKLQGHVRLFRAAPSAAHG